MTDIGIPVAVPEELAQATGLDGQGDLFHALLADAIFAVDECGGGLYLIVGGRDERAGTFVDELLNTVVEENVDPPVLRIETDGGFPSVGPSLQAVRRHSSAASVGVLDPRTLLIQRRHLDTAAMRLRREDVVFGPSPSGGYYFIGSALEEDALSATLPNDIDTATAVAAEGDRTVGFLEMLPVVTSEEQLESATGLVAAMQTGSRTVAPFTSAYLDERTDTS